MEKDSLIVELRSAKDVEVNKDGQLVWDLMPLSNALYGATFSRIVKA